MMLQTIKKALNFGSAQSATAPQSAFLRGLPGGPVLAIPPVVLRDSKEDVRIAWGKAAARTIDAMQNNGWMAGLVEVFVSLMIGEGLRPNFKPDFSWAGWDENQSKAWAKRAQRMFEADAVKPYIVDAGARYNFAQLQAAALRQWMGTGNIVGQILPIQRTGTNTLTKIRLLQSHWLSGRSDIKQGLEQGCYLDRHGATTGYLFEFKDKMGVKQEVKLPAFDYFGRSVGFQIFDGNAGQLRGMSIFAPCLRVLRDYDQLSNATMMASMLHTILAATIESDYPTSDILEALGGEGDDASPLADYLGQKVAWNKTVDINLNQNAKIAHLMMGEKFNLHSSKYPNANYEPFANMLLREIGRCVGAMFEDVTGDYSKMTQASMKAAISKQWPTIIYRRKNIIGPFCDQYSDAWIEEKIIANDLEVPGGFKAFLANRAAICRRDWRGPGKPVPDELKQAKTHETYRNMGVMSDEEIAAERGVDIDDVYESRASEKVARENHKIHGGITNGGTDIDEMIAESDRQEVS